MMESERQAGRSKKKKKKSPLTFFPLFILTRKGLEHAGAMQKLKGQ